VKVGKRAIFEHHIFQALPVDLPLGCSFPTLWFSLLPRVAPLAISPFIHTFVSLGACLWLGQLAEFRFSRNRRLSAVKPVHVTATAFEIPLSQASITNTSKPQPEPV
jgi:hypothetical protein